MPLLANPQFEQPPWGPYPVFLVGGPQGGPYTVLETGSVFTVTLARPASPWAVAHNPATNVQATATKAAAGAGVKNVLTALSCSLSNVSAAAGAINFVRVVDGPSGGANVLFSTNLFCTATPGSGSRIDLSGLWIEGSPNTQMTVEFSGAAGAGTSETVSGLGTTTT